jgi:hypothetical protein
MTRRDILDQYKVDDRGIIRSPGKFEGEMLYVPYFWDAFLNGCADRDDGKVLGFDVTVDDKKEFPELKRRRTVKILEDSNGFVVEV